MKTINNYGEQVYMLSEGQLESYMRTAIKCDKYKKIRRRNEFIKIAIVDIGMSITSITVFLGILAYFCNCIGPM